MAEAVEMDNARRRYEFKKTLEKLQAKQGSGTELISLYIPPDKQIYDVTAQLRDEFGQCSNIKSKQTRTNGPRWMWVLIIIFVNIIGPIIYFVAGRKEE